MDFPLDLTDKQGLLQLRADRWNVLGAVFEVMILRFLPAKKQKKLDTIEDPTNKHPLEDLSCSWATPLKNCLGHVFHRGLARGCMPYQRKG